MARGLSGPIPMSLLSKQRVPLVDLSGAGVLFWFLADVFHPPRSLAGRVGFRPWFERAVHPKRSDSRKAWLEMKNPR